MPTFVLRLQIPELPLTAVAPLRGVVDEIATGTTSTFTGATELLAVLTSAVRAAAIERGAPRMESR